MSDRNARAPGWMKVVLAASLALNLGVAGVLGGIAWRRAADPAPVAHWRAGPGLGLRHALAALPEHDRRALHRAWRADTPEARRARNGDAMTEVLALLRAEPLDADALLAALDAPHARLHAATRSGTALLVARIKAMDGAERRAYADRLTERVRAHGRAAREGPPRGQGG